VLLDDLVVDQLPEALLDVTFDDVGDVGLDESLGALLEGVAQALQVLVQLAADAKVLADLLLQCENLPKSVAGEGGRRKGG